MLLKVAKFSVEVLFLLLIFSQISALLLIKVFAYKTIVYSLKYNWESFGENILFGYFHVTGGPIVLNSFEKLKKVVLYEG